MLNRSASLAMSTSVPEALPGKPNIKRHSPSTMYSLSLFIEKGLAIVQHNYADERVAALLKRPQV